jgi:hypothetical protein
MQNRLFALTLTLRLTCDWAKQTFETDMVKSFAWALHFFCKSLRKNQTFKHYDKINM